MSLLLTASLIGNDRITDNPKASEASAKAFFLPMIEKRAQAVELLKAGRAEEAVAIIEGINLPGIPPETLEEFKATTFHGLALSEEKRQSKETSERMASAAVSAYKRLADDKRTKTADKIKWLTSSAELKENILKVPQEATKDKEKITNLKSSSKE